MLSKILVVDDDEDVCRVYCRILSEIGSTVVSATTGTEALQHLHHDDFELVLADHVVPGSSRAWHLGLTEAAHIQGGGAPSHPRPEPRFQPNRDRRGPISPHALIVPASGCCGCFAGNWTHHQDGDCRRNGMQREDGGCSSTGDLQQDRSALCHSIAGGAVSAGVSSPTASTRVMAPSA